MLIVENGGQKAINRVSGKLVKTLNMVLGPESDNFQGVFCKAEDW